MYRTRNELTLCIQSFYLAGRIRDLCEKTEYNVQAKTKMYFSCPPSVCPSAVTWAQHLHFQKSRLPPNYTQRLITDSDL